MSPFRKKKKSGLEVYETVGPFISCFSFTKYHSNQIILNLLFKFNDAQTSN